MNLEFTVGKYTLESLTNGMYASPFDLYREYIQNAVDSFDEAISNNLCNHDSLMIKINIDSKNKSITIRDNGCGISSESATKTLLDIGNSQKHRHTSRGFRGIGRLSGLGYCDTLTFTTSALDETRKTKIVFNAKRLKELLLVNTESEMSMQSVIEEIVTIETTPEKAGLHYFEVLLQGVDMADKLTNEEQVIDYLVQHCPLPYAKDFTWGSLILSKVQKLGHAIIDYRVLINADGNEQELFKPYKNIFIADRVKKISDTIQDIEVIPFHRNNDLIAVLWYARTNHFGTIMDSQIKGIRIRQGNILVGGKSTCNHFFKEERFNGWIIGELHIIDADLIINSRRDDFEKNYAYYELVNLLEEWSQVITKEIRKKSYERSLSSERRNAIENEDINALNSEALDLLDDLSETSLMDTDESSEVADGDFFETISKLLHMQKVQTKYSALNINNKLTVEQRRVLERVFDIITQECSPEEAETFISLISKKY